MNTYLIFEINNSEVENAMYQLVFLEETKAEYDLFSALQYAVDKYPDKKLRVSNGKLAIECFSENTQESDMQGLKKFLKGLEHSPQDNSLEVQFCQ